MKERSVKREKNEDEEERSLGKIMLLLAGFKVSVSKEEKFESNGMWAEKRGGEVKEEKIKQNDMY